MFVNDMECLEAGIDPKVVEALARRLSKAARECEALGITIFGGTSGELRFHDDALKGPLKLASLDGENWDGGAGDDRDWGDGFMRGE